MREIKFRAFDTQTQKMIKGSTKKFQVINTQGDLASEAQCEGYILMQYTGLKDANGADIYEGDFVKPQYNRLEHVRCRFYNGEYNIKNFDIKKCLVIGNLYQNPELLK